MKKIITVLLLIIIFFSGCEQRKVLTIHDKIVPLASPAAVSDIIDRDYYLDATPSMKGYVTSNNDNDKNTGLTCYVRSLKLISEAGFSQSPTGQEHFWRVDVPLAKINKQEFEVEARKADFYSLDYYNNTGRLGDEEIAKKLEAHPNYGIAYLNQVLENIDPQNLSVIVTDLYEEASNANIDRKSTRLNSSH